MQCAFYRPFNLRIIEGWDETARCKAKLRDSIVKENVNGAVRVEGLYLVRACIGAHPFAFSG